MRYYPLYSRSMNYCCATAIVNELTTKILCTLLRNNMSNKILTFCSVATCFATLSLLNISSAVAGPNVIGGQGGTAVGSDARGVNRTYTTQSNAFASGPKSVGTAAEASFTKNPTTISATANSGAAAGSKLIGGGDTTSNITGVGTLNDATITAKNISNAGLDKAKSGGVSVSSDASLNLNNNGSGFAGGTYNVSGQR
jgi:hypothetical protein